MHIQLEQVKWLMTRWESERSFHLNEQFFSHSGECSSRWEWKWKDCFHKKELSSKYSKSFFKSAQSPGIFFFNWQKINDMGSISFLCKCYCFSFLWTVKNIDWNVHANLPALKKHKKQLLARWKWKWPLHQLQCDWQRNRPFHFMSSASDRRLVSQKEVNVNSNDKENEQNKNLCHCPNSTVQWLICGLHECTYCPSTALTH